MHAVEGLLLSIALWTVAVAGIVWSWNRHVPIVVAAGFDVKTQYRQIDFRQVLRRHTLGWTTFFFGLFSAMGFSSFPLWQRLGIAGMLSVIYGLSRIRRGETQWIAKNDPDQVSMFGKTADRIWYRLLAIGEWAGYLCALVFAAELVSQRF